MNAESAVKALLLKLCKLTEGGSRRFILINRSWACLSPSRRHGLLPGIQRTATARCPKFYEMLCSICAL